MNKSYSYFIRSFSSTVDYITGLLDEYMIDYDIYVYVQSISLLLLMGCVSTQVT